MLNSRGFVDASFPMSGTVQYIMVQVALYQACVFTAKWYPFGGCGVQQNCSRCHSCSKKSKRKAVWVIQSTYYRIDASYTYILAYKCYNLPIGFKLQISANVNY